MGKIRVRDQFDFDAIACPNSFEDDPKVDIYFDRVTQCPTREVLRKATLVKNNPAAKIQKVSLAEAAKRNLQRRAQSFRKKFWTPKEEKTHETRNGKNFQNMTTPVHVTPSTPVISRPPLVPPRTKRVVSRSMELQSKLSPEQDCVKRHAWGRWSFPPADPLTYSVDAEDVKLAQTTPLRSKKVAVAGPVNKSGLQATVTPKRKKSVAKATRIRFETRDSLRKVSLRKSITKIPKASKIPIFRRPYSDVKTKVGEAIRSVFPKKMKPRVSSKAPKLGKVPEREAVNYPRNPSGKTLAELVREFHRSPRQYSNDNPKLKNNRAAWKSYF